MENKEYLFRDMPVRRAVLSLVVPTVISQLITLIYNIADTFFIGQLGDPRQVAAATLAVPLFMMTTGLSNLFGIGGASCISRCLGRGDHQMAKKTAAFSIWSAALISLIYGIVIQICGPWLLPVLGVKADTYAFCRSYLFWTVAIGAVPTVMNVLLSHLVRAEGYSKEAGFGVALGGIMNIILDPIFLFVFKMDIAGAAIATLLSNVIATLYYVWIVVRIQKNKTVITPHPKYFSLQFSIPKDVILSGLPSFIMILMTAISNGVLNDMITAWSTEAMAGMGIAKKIDMIAFSVAQGMSQGVLPLIAYNYSSGNRKRMNKSIKVTLVYALVLAVAAMIVLFIFAEQVTRCFIDNDATVAYGKQFLRIVCLVGPSTAINYMIIAVFQATGQSGKGLVLSCLRKGTLDIPLMFLFNSFASVTAISWATPIADWITLVISIILIVPFIKKPFLSEKRG